jgi:micrococcal nuclease
VCDLLGRFYHEWLADRLSLSPVLRYTYRQGRCACHPTRMKNNPYFIYIGLCLAIFVMAGMWWRALHSGTESSKASYANPVVHIDQTAYYPVTHVMDGDTIAVNINGTAVPIRLLGIDTPETVDPRKPVRCYGPEASAETKSLVTGKTVRLALNPNREMTDKYGRYLAYVYIDGGVFLNDYLVSNGFAREYTVGSAYSFQAQFRNDQAQAQQKDLGLWKACPQGSF